jgi:hypothetical protein
MRYLVDGKLTSQLEAMRAVGDTSEYQVLLEGNDGFPWQIRFSSPAKSLSTLIGDVMRYYPFALCVSIDTNGKTIICQYYDAPPPLKQERELDALIDYYRRNHPKEAREATHYRRLQYAVWKKRSIPPGIDERLRGELLKTLSFYSQV